MTFRRCLTLAAIAAACSFPQSIPFVPTTGVAAFAADTEKASADLAKAIRAGDLEAVKEAVNAGADINALDAKKMPPIGAAALLGKVDILEYLADKGADINKLDGFGYTPLMCAAQRGQAGAVRALLKRGADAQAKGTIGADAMSLARANGPADPQYEQKQLVIKLLQEATANKPAAAAPSTPAAPAPKPAPKPAPAAPKPAAPTAAAEQGEFDDYRFITPNPKVWKSEVKNNNLVFSTSDVPPPDFCTLTLFASRDLPGDKDAFAKEFAAAVAAEGKAQGIKEVQKDSGNKVQDTPGGGQLIMRQMVGETKDFHVYQTFVGVHTGGRFELLAYQASSQESFDNHKAEVQAFIEKLNVEVNRDVAAAPETPKPAKPASAGGLGSLLDSVKK